MVKSKLMEVVKIINVSNRQNITKTLQNSQYRSQFLTGFLANIIPR